MDNDIERNSKTHDRVWAVVTKVQQYVPGALGWIAKQHMKDGSNVWGFVIGERFGTVEVSQLDHVDDGLIRSIATDMLGYAPDSQEDIERRLAENQRQLDELAEQFAKLRAQIQYHEMVKVSLLTTQVVKAANPE